MSFFQPNLLLVPQDMKVETKATLLMATLISVNFFSYKVNHHFVYFFLENTSYINKIINRHYNRESRFILYIN